jgi:hypothetical protein
MEVTGETGTDTPRPARMRGVAVPFAAAFALYVVPAVLIAWPLPARLGTAVPCDHIDPLLNTWLLWWNAQRVPFSAAWWDAAQFHPARGMLAVSEHLAGLGLVSTPLLKLGLAPLQVYNLLFLLSFALGALAAHALAWRLTRRHDAALVAGLAFGFAPYRASQLAHLQVLSAWPMPLVLLGLHLYLSTRRRRWLALFAAAWLVQALINGYFLVFASLLALLWLAWFARSASELRALPALAVAWVVAALPLVPVVATYARVHAEQGFEPRLREIESFSADAAGWLDGAPLLLHRRATTKPAAEDWLYPGLTAPLLVVLAVAWAARARRRAPGRPDAAPPVRDWARPRLALAALAALCALAALGAALFGPWHVHLGPLSLSVKALEKPLGVAFTALAAALVISPGVRAARRRGSPLVFYALATLALWVLCLGPLGRFDGLPIWDKAPYWWLARLPGLTALRVPSRFGMPAALCLATAAALAFAYLLPRAGRRAWLVAALAGAGLLWDGWLAPLPLPAPPERLAALESRDAGSPPGAVLELPLGLPGDTSALYRAMFHGRPVVNGYGGREPRHYALLRQALAQGDLGVLRALAVDGPLDVVVDHAAYRGRWLKWASREPGVQRLGAQGRFTILRLPQVPRAPDGPDGPRLRVRRLRTNANHGDARLALDGDLGTLWSSGRPQSGGERLAVDLGAPRRVGAVILWEASAFMAYPRALRVETSLDGRRWSAAFKGRTAEAAFAACVRAPLGAPLRIALGGVTARHVRLVQTGRDDTSPWGVAELELRAP